MSIPRRYTCEGDNISPPLAWSGAPPGTISFALIVDDPDAPAGTFTHWVLWNLPASVHELPPAVARSEQLNSGARHGKNSEGTIGYEGPCPPSGNAHRYFFRLYALDRKLDLTPASGRVSLLETMKGHILGHAEYVGRYSKGSDQ